MATHSFSLLPISSYYSSCFIQQRHQPNNMVSKFGPNITVTPSFIFPQISSVSSSNSGQFFPIPRPSTVSAISSSLPSAEPDRASSGKSPKWSARAIKSFAMAELEARKLKFPNTGTEALLMGILVEGTSLAAKFLRKNGVTLSKVREETVKLLGRSDMYFFSPEHPPLTAPAQRAIDWAITEKLKSGETGEVTATHFLLGIWSEKESAGHKILTGFGFDDEKMKEIAKTMDKDYVSSFKKGV